MGLQIRIRNLKCVLLMALALGMNHAALAADDMATNDTGTSQTDTLIDTIPYAKVLADYVDAAGDVDYKGLKTGRAPLDLYIDAMQVLPQSKLEAATNEERLAFWINAYNALTLRSIIDHYPIKTTDASAPANSIMQIDGVWDKQRWQVAGRSLTLNEIEHEILRKDFTEPRIHLAINCASRGCPALTNEPYLPESFEIQLARQAAAFVESPRNLKIDHAERRVQVSKIFEWFGEDFVALLPEGHKSKDATHDAILYFLSQYEPSLNWPEANDYSIYYLDYDWTLNEQ